MLPRRFCLPRTTINLGTKAKLERGVIRALALRRVRTFLSLQSCEKLKVRSHE